MQAGVYPVTAHRNFMGFLMADSERKRAARANDYEPKTDFQKWLKPLLDKNVEDGKTPSTYQELTLELIRRGFDTDESRIYRIVRGDPAKYANAKRPGYDLAVAIGEVMGDELGAITAAGYTLPKIVQNTVRISEEAHYLAHYFEGLPPGPERDELRNKAQEEQARRRRESSNVAYQNSSILGKRPANDDDVERIPEE